MRVSTRLSATAVISVAAIAIIGIVVTSTSYTVSRELAKNQSAGQILDAVTGIRYLTMEYVMNHERRPRAQVLLRQTSLGNLLDDRSSLAYGADARILDNLRDADADVRSLFEQLVANNELRKGDQRANAVFEELEARLTGQIMVRLETMISDAFTLSERSRNRVQAAQRREDWAVGAFGVLILLVLSMMLFISLRGVLRPLARLRAGTALVGAGDLDFRLDEGRSDEIGDLARAFNEMTAKLQGQKSERDAAQDALTRTRADLAHMARVTSLGALTASIAHEVNQPLSGIITNASTGLRMLAAEPPNVEGARETVRRTIRDGNRAAEVIVRLRALFEKKGATTELVDLNEAAREVIALSSGELRRARIALREMLADDLPPVTGDRVQLQQVILNLILNASEATIGAVEDSRDVIVRTKVDDGGSVQLSVSDSGAGFDPITIDRLFDAFYTTKSNGMGIGLSVSRTIIESHRGRIWAEANESSGATFSFTIPRRVEAVTTGAC